MSIVELPPGTVIPDGAEDEASEVSISEPPEEKSPSVQKRKSKEQKAKRKMTETPTLLDPDLSHKKRTDQVVSTPPETRSAISFFRFTGVLRPSLLALVGVGDLVFFSDTPFRL